MLCLSIREFDMMRMKRLPLHVPSCRMGIQGSTIRTTGGKIALEPTSKATRAEKVRIDILAFEVASVMSKLVYLWQSLSEQEVRRFKTEVMKSDGVLNLVSDNEGVLLSLACMEKIQDLTTIAQAVSRLGKRCHEPELVGFQHIYNDILKQNIDVSELEFPQRQIQAKMKKMEKYIRITASLYQELEILNEMEQALHKLQVEADPTQQNNRRMLEQKAVWQRQEIKYLKEISLWNRTYDKIVGLLARTICTIYGKIIRAFGFPIGRWPEILFIAKNRDVEYSGSSTSCLSTEEPKLSNSSINGSVSPAPVAPIAAVALETKSTRISVSSFSAGSLEDNLSSASIVNMASVPHANAEKSPTPQQFAHQRSMSANYVSRIDKSLGSSTMVMNIYDDLATRSSDHSECLLWTNELVNPLIRNAARKFCFDPKMKLQNAPQSTLGGAGLALHYANMIVLIEKMAKCPHLINQELRDELYQMLPKNIAISLRNRLRSCVKICSSPEISSSNMTHWRDTVERNLGWLVPLAQNMIRWQSAHNFEQQQQSTARTNVLLLQTLYFVDQTKAELIITELLVGLNNLWKHEKNPIVASPNQFSKSNVFNGCLEWNRQGTMAAPQMSPE